MMMIYLFLGILPLCRLKAAEGLFSKYFSLELYDSLSLSNTFGFRSKMPVGEIRFTLCEDDYNFGLTATNDRLSKNYPFYFKCGNLSAGGLLSKMNNPLISASASPFAGSSSSASGITASLPGYSSFSKPVSLFFQGGFSRKKFSVKSNCWYSPEEEKLAASFCLLLPPLWGTAFSLSSAAGLFPYPELKSSSWFLEEPYYAAGGHFCSAFQLSAVNSVLKICITGGANESPFGPYKGWLRTESRLSFSRFSFTASAFYSDSSFLSASAKVIEPQCQFRINLRYKTVYKGKKFPVFINSGLSIYNGLNLCDEEHAFKAGIGSQFLFPLTMIQLSAVANMQLKTELPEFFGEVPVSGFSFSFNSATLQAKNVWYIGKFSPSLAAAVTTSPSENYNCITNTYRFSAALNYSTSSKVNITSNAAFSLTEKNSEISKQKLTLSASAAFLWKKVKCTFRLSFDF